IRLPHWLGGVISKGSAREESVAGSFFTGVLATILATPCTAPFLGTAIGFALSGPPSDIFLIFAVMGLGMALPFIILALFPRAVWLLPRPGAWMVKVKYFLGLLLLATALWLGWVLSKQVDWFDSKEERQETGQEWLKFSEVEIAGFVGQGR